MIYYLYRFEIRKNLDLRKILFTPKIFLKSRFHCTENTRKRGKLQIFKNVPWLNFLLIKSVPLNFVVNTLHSLSERSCIRRCLGKMQLCAITQRWCYFACYVARMTKFFATWLIIIAGRPLSGLHLTLLANLDTSSKITYRISLYIFHGNYFFFFGFGNCAQFK